MALALDRREGAGLGLAVLAHIGLFALMVLAIRAPENPLKLESTPIEVSLTDEVGLKSEAPVIQKEAPAERLAEVPAPPEPNMPEPVPQTQPEPVRKPDPTPPKAAPAPNPLPKKAAEKSNPAPAKAQQKTAQKAVRPTGRLTGIVDGLTDQPSKGKATRPQASQIGQQVKSALAAEVIRQLRPHWRAPTGADVELLRTQVEIRLKPDGSLAAPPRVIGQTGVNASNRVQAELHKERALNAATLAAPFKLPAEYYEAWKLLRPTFDRRL